MCLDKFHTSLSYKIPWILHFTYSLNTSISSTTIDSNIKVNEMYRYFYIE